jgi:hypothetical protein
MCDHVWIFEARTVSTASPATMRDVRSRDRMEPSCREPGIQTHGGPDQGTTLMWWLHQGNARSRLTVSAPTSPKHAG